ncbi:Na+/H+ antiporter [Hymenobacter psychrotolerans]|uniref:Monovalent cation:H+ antiporter, CPA1 family n=1 Tax=Hymenobacter psychrotolerans DSM 18569 TaxID=1121959 RepID=A0A1M6PLY9_9BACT|nr:Na+/H+ antiporter [Hymenobacter psychrotolerans]SHK08867.1 monovalent cation:H+ antiporter, CPA1 family [Hymenobacter psychrotolerans DSM 18569]
MHEDVLLVLGLLFIMLLLVMLSQRLRISYPIFLVLGGLALSLVPGLPRIVIDHELIFLIFLPPLLYEAAWYTSWHDFWRWKRPIVLLAFGLVFFTSTIVAYVSRAMIPGFTLPLGFLLGGIISPPDAVAATSVLKGIKVPRRITTILEGESLINDASSLIVFRFALAAVVSGTFVWQQAVGTFLLVSSMGLVVGLAVAQLFYFIHRYLPTTPSINTALTFIAPYSMYLLAEEFHFSGVLAVVSGGLLMSYHSHRVFDANTRLQSTSVWASVGFVLNGLVFILIGLELPVAVEGLGSYSLQQAIIYSLVISVIVIVIRLAWMYPAAFVPRWFSSIRASEPSPGWQGTLILGWAGMRGVVSLASALSVPLLLSGGQAFPQRNLILFITFVVILVTLVFQGLTLPAIIRFTRVSENDTRMPADEQEAGIRLRLRAAALAHMGQHYTTDMRENELIRSLHQRMHAEAQRTGNLLEALDYDDSKRQALKRYHQVLLDVLRVQREELLLLRREGRFEDEMLRHQEAQLDLDEAKISHMPH